MFRGGQAGGDIPLPWIDLKQVQQIGQDAANGPRISSPDNRVSAWVIPTNEELMIARHTPALVRPG